MRQFLFAICGLYLLATPVIAGEVHIISRDSIGYFLASQQIYGNKQRGMVEVRYCNKSYFAFPSTVAWTEDETENGRTVGVEYGDGKIWKLICRNPQEQVRYADVRKPSFGQAFWFREKKDDKAQSFHGK